MKKSVIAMFAVGALSVVFLTGMAQPQDEKGPKKGPPGEKKGWEPGKIIPPHVRDILELSEEQERKIADLEKEVRSKLLKIFTEEQQQRLRDFNDKGPKGPPKDKDGPPPEKKGKKGKDKDKDRDRYDGEEVSSQCPRAECESFVTRVTEYYQRWSN